MSRGIDTQRAFLDIGSGRSKKGIVSIDVTPMGRPDVVATGLFLPFRTGSIPSIVCSHVIEHIEELDSFLKEVIRVLAETGLAVFFVPNDESRVWRIIEPVWDRYYSRFVDASSSPDTHCHSFDRNKLRAFLEVYFDEVVIDSINLGMELVCHCTVSNGSNMQSGS